MKDIFRPGMQPIARRFTDDANCRACHKDLTRNAKADGPVSVEGRLAHENYEGKNGQARSGCVGCHRNLAHLPVFDERIPANTKFAQKIKEIRPCGRGNAGGYMAIAGIILSASAGALAGLEAVLSGRAGILDVRRTPEGAENGGLVVVVEQPSAALQTEFKALRDLPGVDDLHLVFADYGDDMGLHIRQICPLGNNCAWMSSVLVLRGLCA